MDAIQHVTIYILSTGLVQVEHHVVTPAYGDVQTAIWSPTPLLRLTGRITGIIEDRRRYGITLPQDGPIPISSSRGHRPTTLPPPPKITRGHFSNPSLPGKLPAQSSSGQIQSMRGQISKRIRTLSSSLIVSMIPPGHYYLKSEGSVSLYKTWESPTIKHLLHGKFSRALIKGYQSDIIFQGIHPPTRSV